MSFNNEEEVRMAAAEAAIASLIRQGVRLKLDCCSMTDLGGDILDALESETQARPGPPPDGCLVDEDGCCVSCGRTVEGCEACETQSEPDLREIDLGRIKLLMRAMANKARKRWGPQVHAFIDSLDEPTTDLIEYKPCRICAAKPGSPLLCPSCLHNRTIINQLKERLSG